MLKERFKLLLPYWVEITLGLLIFSLSNSIHWFLLYFFIIFFVVSISLINYLRKGIRVFQVFNEIKLLTIIRKLNITEDELSIVADGERRRMGEKTWQEIENELKSLIRGNQ